MLSDELQKQIIEICLCCDGDFLIVLIKQLIYQKRDEHYKLL